MKKTLYLLFFFCAIFLSTLQSPVSAVYNVETDIGPIPCFGGACPPDLSIVYDYSGPAIPASAYQNEVCVPTYEQFLTEPHRFHFWAEDIEVTNQGKADERARQFIYWVINKPALDNHVIISSVWSTTRNISYFFVIIVAAIIGIGFIIGQRTNFNLKIKVWPAIWKILLALLYITLSYAIVLFLIQLSEFIMKFFIDTLGGGDLFNIYFTADQSSESNYTYFYGCRDLNIRVQEAAEAQILMLKFTNITYYVMGSMLLLRKILLWFMLFVSPFLAILMPFVFIRNTGWIWIGVFFQWLFYGPLFALFLGALSSIWKAGIPFQFDFSRRGTPDGYIYPTAIRILYGGPAQRLSLLNNANYIDTFVEYVITLIMLWAVIFFPWWLLRIFRDYCCDVFAAANNVLLSMYDQMRAGPIAPPPSSFTPKSPPRSTRGTARDIPRGEGRTAVERPVAVRVQTMSEIKQTKTQDILSSLNLYAPRLTDIARFETNKESKSAVEKNLSFIANPVKAETPTERQQYMNIRTELFSRASKEDSLARGVISSTSTSFVEKEKRKEEILKDTPQAVPVSQAVSSTTQISQEKVQSITNNILNSVVNNNTAVSSIAQNSQVSQEQVKSILNTYSQNMAQPTNQVINTIAQSTNTSKEKVAEVIKQAMNVSEQSNIVSQTATSEKISNETVQKVLQTLPMAVQQQQAQQQNQTMTQNIATIANVPQEKAQSITNNIFNTVANNTKITNALAQSTNLSQQQVKSVLSSYSQNVSQPASQIVSTVSQKTDVSKEKVAEVLQKSNLIMQQSAIVKETASSEKTDAKTVEKVVQAVHESITAEAPSKVQTGVSVEKSQSITNSIFNTVINDTSIMQTLQQETNLPANQLRNVLTTYNQNVTQTPEVITERIAQSAGIEKEKVAPVLRKVLSTVGKESVVSAGVMNDIAKKENVKVSDIKKVVDAQVPLVTEADQHIEKSIPIPSSISLEDYEEVKKMWTQQYEKGEVPTTENIASREQWVDQDTVTISNTLNKLMSTDESLRREGLDDLGYILPIFMINNLKGDEMMVYLKAKLEAAKTVKTQMIKVKEVTTQAEPEEIFVDIDRSQTETAPKVLHMEVEEEVSQQPPEIRITDSGNSSSASFDEPSSLGDTIASVRVKSSQPVFTLNVDEIKGIKTNDLIRNMNMFAAKLSDIARLDTNRQTRETVIKHVEYLANPEKASSTEERQTYMDLRSELSTRGAEDQVAKQLVTPSKEHILQSVPQAIPAANVISSMVQLPEEKIQSITSSVIHSVAQNNTMVSSISQTTQLPQDAIQNIFNSFTQSLNLPPNQIIVNVAQQTNIPKEKVAQVLQQINTFVEHSKTTEMIEQKELVNTETVQKIIQIMTSSLEHIPDESIVQKSTIDDIVQQTNIPAGTVRTITQSTLTHISGNPSMVQYIQEQTGLNQDQIQTIISTLSNNLDKPTNIVINQITEQTGIAPKKVSETFDTICYIAQSKKTVKAISETTKTEETTVDKIIQSISTVAKHLVADTTPLSQAVADETKVSEQQAHSIIKSVINNAITNDPLLQNVQNTSGINQNQVKNILTTYMQNANQPLPILVDRIAQSAGIKKSKVLSILKTVMKILFNNVVNSKDVIKEIATKEGVTSDQITKVFSAQIPVMTSPEENVEKTIPLPAAVSIEDYEEVKNMWAQQYENGEVPTDKNISSREQWISLDIVMLTNILNKLLSPDEELRKQALDEIGFLLPIFMINNLSGEELLVYLRAKLEAAKSIIKQMKNEKELKNKLKKMGADDQEEDLVKVKNTEDEDKNTNKMEMKVERDPSPNDTSNPPVEAIGSTTNSPPPEELEKK